LQGFFWASGALAAISCGFAIACLVAYADFTRSDGGPALDQRLLEQEWLDRDEGLVSSTALFVQAWLITLILLIVWTSKAHRVSRTMWLGGRTWGAGSAVGGWFVPIGNLWIPQRVLSEVEQIVTWPREDGVAVSPGWRGRSTSAIGLVWWFTLLAGFLPLLFSAVIDHSGEDGSFAVRAFYAIRLMGFACWAASCVAGAIYVRRLTRDANA
jgi:FtsH-binding integral membrane protein